MKRIILSAIIALGALAASAQVVNASQPRLLDGVTGDGSVISPDGTRVLFHLVGRGVFTANIDGTDVKAVHSRLVMPVWAGNDVVLGTVTTDDGVNFLTGVLTAVSVADGATQDLTGADIIALDPSASADGSRAVFTTPAGAVYTLTLK